MKAGTDDRKSRLVGLGAESLADALLELSWSSEVAQDLIERLLSTPRENVRRFKRKLSGLKRRTRFVDWRASARLVEEIGSMLEDLRAGVSDPQPGLELVAAFFEADEAILGHCDDSSGSVGDLFTRDAKDLFVDYASRCGQKERVADTLLRVNQTDPFGVRASLLVGVGAILNEAEIRRMVAQTQEWAEAATGFDKSHYGHLIEALAREMGDAALFERTRMASSGDASYVDMMAIARVYLESGDVETAHAWLGKIPEDEAFRADEREELLLEIYRKQGETEKLTHLLYQRFRACHVQERLEDLLEVIGPEKREAVLAWERVRMLESHTFDETDVTFFLEIGAVDDAETYLLDRAEALADRYYGTLLPLARAMEDAQRNLAASLIYRSLLVSILERANTKHYVIGVR